ncbi:MAG TPA: right-handed parallel beta-helix repeat-containing protein [Armatimonadota bacterium]|jgi:parallel beta-helix repeat protein
MKTNESKGTDMHEQLITAGKDHADFCGTTNRAIQAAVDAVAISGGGTVRVLPGTYLLEDSIHLRENVTLVGSGPETILRKAPERSSRLSADLGYGHYDVSLADPDHFEVGMGITIRDNNAGGFYETIATLTWREGDRFGIDQMLNHDYSRRFEAEVYTSFPPISARFVSNVGVHDLIIEGNKEQNPHRLNGCRGGGVYLIGVKDAQISQVTVRNMHGDGISFQQCRNIHIEECVIADNACCGLHPGSGSVGAVMQGVTCRNNGFDGVFFCLRATYCRLESCTISGNNHHGISVGGRDTHNAIQHCTVNDNGLSGIYFRESDEAMAGHFTLIEGNTVRDNCTRDEDAEIFIPAPVHDVQILRNTIERSPERKPVYGLRMTNVVEQVTVFDNQFRGKFWEPIQADCPPQALSTEAPETELPVGPEAAPANADRHLPPRVQMGEAALS